MASIFEIIEGLTVEKEDILEAELFAEQWLSAQFPTYDFRQGTALRDMTVRPNATLLALINKAIVHYYDETDIINVTNDTDEEIVDSKLSNFFIERKTGDKASVRSRLYFSFPTANPIIIQIPSSATFSTDGEIEYSTLGNITVNPPTDVEDPSMYYFRWDDSEQMHYVDVDMTSSTESLDANLEEGDLLYFTVFSPYFLKGSIQYLVSMAVEKETNEEMVERSYSAVSTRNLINTPSIISRITDQFNYAKDVMPVGLGDPLMYRDLIDLEDPHNPGTIRSHHRGGMTDAYIKTPHSVTNQKFELDANRQFVVSGPIISLSQSTIDEDGEITPGAAYTYESSNVSAYTDNVPDEPMKDIGLSAESEVTVTMPLNVPGEVASFDVQVFSGIGSIDDAINSKDQRVVCADYLVRSYEATFVDIDIVVRTGDPLLYPDAIQAVRDYIEDIPPGGTMYIAAIIAAVQGAGVTDFVMPVEAFIERQHRYLEFDSSDPGVSDTTSEVITDRKDLERNQAFFPRTINVEEGVILP